MIFRVAETELMPRLVVAYTEPGCSKLKKGKGFLKPNFGLGPNLNIQLGNCERLVNLTQFSCTQSDGCRIAYTCWQDNQSKGEW